MRLYCEKYYENNLCSECEQLDKSIQKMSLKINNYIYIPTNDCEV